MQQIEIDFRADGVTYDASRDKQRLGAQMQDVFDLMKDGEWRSIYAISAALHHMHPEQSISSRLRDLRKERFGSHTVERRHVVEGTWEYRLLVSE